jgi:hypothetical protein
MTRTAGIDYGKAARLWGKETERRIREALGPWGIWTLKIEGVYGAARAAGHYGTVALDQRAERKRSRRRNA